LASDQQGALRSAISEFSEANPETATARVLSLELSVADRAAARVAEALADWPKSEAADREADRDRALIAALVLEASGDADAAARRRSAAALGADATSEAAARALISRAPPEGAQSLLAALADVATDNAQASLLLVEAALRGGAESEKYVEFLRRAVESQPALPF